MSKLVCKRCNTGISKEDLVESEDLPSAYHENEEGHEINRGIYIIDDSVDSPAIMCNPESTIIEIPEWEYGCGCCGHDHLQIECPRCSTLIGVGKLDCWQTRRMEFASSLVKIEG